MTLEEYETFVSNRMSSLSAEEQALFASMNIAGEAGEVLDLYKKYYFGKHRQLDYDNLVLELGDVLFSIIAICNVEGISLEHIMQSNYEKLANSTTHPALHFRGSF